MNGIIDFLFKSGLRCGAFLAGACFFVFFTPSFVKKVIFCKTVWFLVKWSHYSWYFSLFLVMSCYLILFHTILSILGFHSCVSNQSTYGSWSPAPRMLKFALQRISGHACQQWHVDLQGTPTFVFGIFIGEVWWPLHCEGTFSVNILWL